MPDDPRDTDPTRDAQGRFKPGQSGNPETQWGPDNPPPKSPGRPKKDAWVGQLQEMLENDDRVAEALAGRLMKIALKGRDGDALKALEMIQTRIGGPVKQMVEAELRSETRKIIIVPSSADPPPLPEGVLQLEALRAKAEDAAQVRRAARDSG